MSNTTEVKDLTKEPAASPSHRVGGYVILARLADKARAEFLGGNVGEYHTDCPLDHMLLDWKGVSYDEIRREIEGGADNESLAKYLDTHGTPKTPEEVKAWADGMEQINPAKSPDKREWFLGELQKLGLDPENTTLFQWLDADDRTIGK